MSARTDTVLIPIIDGELADTTTEIPAPWLRPPVTSRPFAPRPATPSSRMVHRWHRVRTSEFVTDVHIHIGAGVRRRLAVMGVLAVVLAVAAIGRGIYVAVQMVSELIAQMTWLIP